MVVPYIIVAMLFPPKHMITAVGAIVGDIDRPVPLPTLPHAGCIQFYRECRLASKVAGIDNADNNVPSSFRTYASLA
jgi:hypothetical protein